MLHPNQFQVNEAWIAFQLNSRPIPTNDGDYHCAGLMDAASLFLLGTALFRAEDKEPSKREWQRMLKKAWTIKQQYPATIFVAAVRFPAALPAVAERLKLALIPLPEDQLAAFIGEPRRDFDQYLQSVEGKSRPL